MCDLYVSSNKDESKKISKRCEPDISHFVQQLKDLDDYENAAEIGFQKFCNNFNKVVREEFKDIPDDIWNMETPKEWSLSAAIIPMRFEQEKYNREFFKSLSKAIYDIFLYGEDKYTTFNTSKGKRTGILISDNSKNVEVELLEFSPGINRKRETRTGVIIKRHKKKHKVIIYPYGIRPIN